MKYIDIHGHMNFAAYDPDREEAIKRAHDAGVAMITVGTNASTSKQVLELAKAHDNMYAAVGLHPIHTEPLSDHADPYEKEISVKSETADHDAYLALARDPKVIAIGECGLDYYHLDEQSIAKQRKAFETMIDVANEVNKPLMLHLRSGSGKSAYNDAFEIIKDRAKVKGNLHFFAGSIEEAKPFLDLGFTFSFTGVITFARNYDEVIKYLPMDRIMSETDCPYVSPIPYRGKRNEPAYVIEVVKMLAKIKGMDDSMVANQILINAGRLFNIKF